MKNDEKKCPLTKMTCYGEECGWWWANECAVNTLANAVQETANESYIIRRALEDSGR